MIANHTSQVIIVFGATGSVGSIAAARLAELGHFVVVHYCNNEQMANQIVKEFHENNYQGMALQADCTDENQIYELVKIVYEELGVVHAVVNFIHNDSFQPKLVSQMNWNDWDCHIDALKAHFSICHAVIPFMQEQNYGRIVYISGALAYRFYAGFSHYSAAKAAMNAFSKTLAHEIGSQGITVNIVAPGKVVTKKSKLLQEDDIAKCPLKQYATPVDIANIVHFLTSKEAESVTGQTIYLAGGEVMPMP